MPEVNIILPDIRSALNVGSIFRTADTVGVSKIYLTGYTPAPVDKFNRINKEIAKTALGAEKTIKWKKVENITKLLAKLKKDKFYLIAVEQDKNSVDYKKIKIKDQDKISFIFGNEVVGLPENVLSKCNLIVEIPMRGEKESLNVAVSAGGALGVVFGILVQFVKLG